MVVGLLCGWLARKVQSTIWGIVLGSVLGLLFAFFVAAMDTVNGKHAYVEIMLPGFIVGAITMPLCCVLMAHNPKLRHLFAVPVVSLILAGTLTLWEVIKL